MLKKINKKIIIQYIGIFLFFLFWNLIINVLQNDEIWNYGFAHNIYKGLVPYRDFNMVITPFYPLIMSLPFHLFGSSMLVFHIENAIILTAIVWLAYRLIHEKIFIFLTILFFLSNSLTSPGYNVFIVFLLFLMMYLEKNKGNDYWIGFIISLSFLTKQSIGIFLLLPSIYYLKKDWKKVGKRLIGFMIPCMFFLLYLLISHTVSNFLDLCLFGLFDFGERNGSILNYKIVFFVVYIILCYTIIKKDKNNINHYYVMAFASMMIPLLDFYHCALAYLILITDFLSIYDFKTKLPIKYIFYASTVGVAIIMFFTYHSGYKIIYPNTIPHFEYRMIREDSQLFTKRVVKYIEENPDTKYTFLVSGGYYFRLVTDTEMSYLDLINYGNFGYHGSQKLLSLIQKNKDSVFIISKQDLNDKCQADKNAINYVIKHGKKFDSIQIYDLYVIE